MHSELYSAAHPIRLKVKYPLHIFDCYVQPVAQQYESRTIQKSTFVTKVATMKMLMVSLSLLYGAMPINCHLKSEVSHYK